MSISLYVLDDVISDSLLTALYRYLCGFGDALLFDPLLHRLVNVLMNKLFKRLISELRKLGVKIVYADFNRIIVDTNKEVMLYIYILIIFVYLSIRVCI